MTNREPCLELVQELFVLRMISRPLMRSEVGLALALKGYMELGNLIKALEMDEVHPTIDQEFMELTCSSLYLEINSFFMKKDLKNLDQVIENLKRLKTDDDLNVQSLYFIALINKELLTKAVRQETVNSLNDLILKGTSFEAEIYYKLGKVLEVSNEFWLAQNYFSKAIFLFHRMGARRKSLEAEMGLLDAQIRDTLFVRHEEIIKGFENLIGDSKTYPGVHLRILLRLAHLSMLHGKMEQGGSFLREVKENLQDHGLESLVLAHEFYYELLMGDFKKSRKKLELALENENRSDAIDYVMNLAFDNVAIENILITSGLIRNLYEMSAYYAKLTRDESLIIHLLSKAPLTMEQLLEEYSKKKTNKDLLPKRLENLMLRIEIKKPGLISVSLDDGKYKLASDQVSFEYYWALKKNTQIQF